MTVLKGSKSNFALTGSGNLDEADLACGDDDLAAAKVREDEWGICGHGLVDGGDDLITRGVALEDDFAWGIGDADADFDAGCFCALFGGHVGQCSELALAGKTRNSTPDEI